MSLAGETRPDYKFTIEPNFGHDFDQEWNEESWCPENEVGYKGGLQKKGGLQGGAAEMSKPTKLFYDLKGLKVY